MKQEIKQLSQIEHCLKRPSMYIGSVALEQHQEFMLESETSTLFTINERNYIPGMMKLFNEVIDNSIDEYVRTDGKFADKIFIKMTNTIFECTDNGRGIPNTKMKTLNGDTKYQAEVAFTEMLSGANYENDDEATIGTNGLGSKAAAIFSTKTLIHNDDGKSRITITTKNNLSEVDVKEGLSTASGVHTKLWPDLKYFGIEELTQTDFNIIKERLLHLSISYPGITFKFNGKSLKLNDKKYFEMFNIHEFIKVNDNVSIGITHSPSDQFEHFSLVNGLLTRKGGSHIKLISDEIINPIRAKLVKKFKTIKPGDIRQKLRIVVIFKNFMNAKYTSQTKEELTNAEREIKSHLGVDAFLVSGPFEKFTKKILKNDDIMLPITELFLLKEQAKQNAELKKLSKTKKKLKLEKYLPATVRNKYLLITEGASATGGLIGPLGREHCGFFELKGKPLNSYSQTQAKFTANKEMSELYQVIISEGYEYIINATDQDLDGIHIRGLLIGMVERYLPDYKHKIGNLNTPVIGIKKNRNLVRWTYSLKDTLIAKKGEESKYYKGIGSWNEKDLLAVIQKDGLERMIDMLDFDSTEAIDDWLGDTKADKRKEMIMLNEFSITKL